MIQRVMPRQPHIPTHRAGEPHTRKRQAPSHVRPTVLIVDDDTSIVELLAEVLDDAGYEVWTAANGYAALRLSKLIHPELVLTDYTMPELNGTQLVRELRRYRATRNIPVVLMSATRPSRDELRGMPFLAKPFDLDEVIEIVAQQVDATADETTA